MHLVQVHPRQRGPGELPLLGEGRQRVFLDFMDVRPRVPGTDVPVTPLARDGRRLLGPVHVLRRAGAPPLPDEFLRAAVRPGGVDPVDPRPHGGVEHPEGVVAERLDAAVGRQLRGAAGTDVRRAAEHGGADGPPSSTRPAAHSTRSYRSQKAIGTDPYSTRYRWHGSPRTACRIPGS